MLDLDRDAGDLRTRAFVAQAIAARRATLETEMRLVEQQARQRDAVISDRLRSLEADQRRAHADASGAQRRVELTARTLDRFSQLARDGFVSPLQTQGKEQEWLDATARERDVQRIAAAMARDIEATRANEPTTRPRCKLNKRASSVPLPCSTRSPARTTPGAASSSRRRKPGSSAR